VIWNQDAREILPYMADWRKELGYVAVDPIVTSVWTCDSQLHIDASSFTANTATALISIDGSAVTGVTYSLTNTITSAGGIHEPFVFHIKITPIV
jgi:hypothetical protein